MRDRDVIEDRYRLSPMQQGMLYHSLSDRGAGLYVQQLVLTIPGSELNVETFRRAWEVVIARHPSLRATFHWEGDAAPTQHIHARVAVPFAFEDWRESPPALLKDRLEGYLETDRSRGFSLTEAPLMRLAVFRTGHADSLCVWTAHHLLADGHSVAVILKEVCSLYDAFLRGDEPQWSPPPRYRDHIAWLESRKGGSEAESFWREALDGFTAPTPLAIDRPAGSTYEGPPVERTIPLDSATVGALEALAERHLLTLNTFIQGAWALLLSRYSGEEDVVFGAVRACRRTRVEGAEAMVGVLMNTLPIRTQVPPDMPLIPWLKGLRLQQVPVLKHEHTPLVDVQRWSDVPPGTPLFDSVLDVADYSLSLMLREIGERWKQCTVAIHEKTNYPLTLYADAEPGWSLKIGYDPLRFDDGAIRRMLGHLETLLTGMATEPDRHLGEFPLLTEAEKRRMLVAWNDTRESFPREACVHHLVEAQVSRTPDSPAVRFEDQELTYRELNARANQLARYLGKAGVRPGARVGICVERSLDMMIGLLGVLKAGAAYVPLDPSYPQERLAFIVDDAGIETLITQESLRQAFPHHDLGVLCIDASWPAIAQEPDDDPDVRISSDGLAYVMYTSGSTGKPKGVMVRHRNVVSFLAAMNGRIDGDPGGVWLAVTSISFDISVLELFWPLTRGFKVIIQSAAHATEPTAAAGDGAPAGDGRAMDFSLFYFASNEDDGSKNKYRLLLEGARFADRHGFSAVWTPERHFHAFGGLYPNPSVAGAAIAAVTERIQIRAGSVVMPLQNPIRVAEEWSVVDNISRGRVGISFASGWHANDFALAPANYEKRKEITFRDIETVRRLWRGEKIKATNGSGKEIEVRIHPSPVQDELPVWVTAAGDPETFRTAGAMGANLLTHLLGHNVESLAGKIDAYRKAWKEHGHDRDGREGRVTLMLHTFVGDDLDTVKETVRGPLMSYLRTASDLVQKLAAGASDRPGQSSLSEEDMKALHEAAFERFFGTSGLLGTPETCLAMIGRLKAIGVDEVACLIDFGVDFDAVMASLEALDRVREMSLENARRRRARSIPAQIAAHGVTHLQCTPSLARMLAMNRESLQALEPLRCLMIGGEAFPASLADELLSVVSGDVLNMYGPTETTIWSTTSDVRRAERPVPIGRPIANTRTYVLDRRHRPVPIGVPGELFIGGEGVAAGYHGRPELTAERFISDPFSTAPGDRLYRTGDMVRYLADGSIDFLGRTDSQVKVRGHRIELGEIETVLQELPGVREAVVVAREDQPGDQRLIAYVVADPSSRDGAGGALRAALETRLPAPMIPATFVMLDALPRTPNGKPDRLALPAPDQTRSNGDFAFVGGRSHENFF